MSHLSRRCAAVLLASVVVLGGCGHAVDTPPAGDAPVQLTPIPGTGLKSVALSAEAANRIGIKTTPVAAAAGGAAGQLQVPYAGIVYDEQGGTWVYSPTGPNTYVRQRVKVDHIAGTVAVLSEGPAAGSEVVTEGSQELLGAEYEISGEG